MSSENTIGQRIPITAQQTSMTGVPAKKTEGRIEILARGRELSEKAFNRLLKLDSNIQSTASDALTTLSTIKAKKQEFSKGQITVLSSTGRSYEAVPLSERHTVLARVASREAKSIGRQAEAAKTEAAKLRYDVDWQRYKMRAVDDKIEKLLLKQIDAPSKNQMGILDRLKGTTSKEKLDKLIEKETRTYAKLTGQLDKILAKSAKFTDKMAKLSTRAALVNEASRQRFNTATRLAKSEKIYENLSSRLRDFDSKKIGTAIQNLAQYKKLLDGCKQAYSKRESIPAETFDKMNDLLSQIDAAIVNQKITTVYGQIRDYLRDAMDFRG